MKNLFTIVCLSALSSAAIAQAPHVFTKANGPQNPVGTDTVYGVTLSQVPSSIPDAQNHIWDFSNVGTASYKYYAVFAAATGVGSATHSNLAYVDIAPGMKYQTKLMFAVEANGIKTYGERLARQAFSLGAQSGNPADSLVVLQQDVTYTAPQVQMPYPATIGTKWNSTSKSITNLTISYTPPSPLPPMTNQPAQRKSTITSTCEVVGWGAVRVKRLDGKSSGAASVLQVKSTVSTQDSLFINGSPAPAALLTAAGLTQGETRIVYQKSYYRQYEMLPVVNITYSDATFTTRDDFNVHAQRLNYPDNINDVDNVPIAEIFPNPSNGIFSVKLPEGGDGAWSYTVTDMTGKKIAAGVLNLGNTNTQTTVSLAGIVTPGTYIVTVSNDGAAVSGQKIMIQ